MAHAMAHNVTHYARLVLHVTYVHIYYTIITARKHNATKTVITPILKYIGLVRRRPLDWAQLEIVTLIEASQAPHGGAKRAKTHHSSSVIDCKKNR